MGVCGRWAAGIVASLVLTISGMVTAHAQTAPEMEIRTVTQGGFPPNSTVKVTSPRGEVRTFQSDARGEIQIGVVHAVTYMVEVPGRYPAFYYFEFPLGDIVSRRQWSLPYTIYTTDDLYRLGQYINNNLSILNTNIGLTEQACDEEAFEEAKAAYLAAVDYYLAALNNHRRDAEDSNPRLATALHLEIVRLQALRDETADLPFISCPRPFQATPAPVPGTRVGTNLDRLEGAQGVDVLPAPAGNLERDPDEEPVEYVRICDPGLYYIPGTATCLKISGTVGAENHYFGGRIGIGTIEFDNGSTDFLSESDDRLWGASIGGDIGFGAGVWVHDVGLDFSWTDEEASGEVPPGGENTGYTFGTDAFGSTGIFFGDTGAAANEELDWRQFSLNYQVMRAFNLGSRSRLAEAEAAERRSRKELGLVVSYEYDSLDHSGDLWNLTFPDDIRTSMDQELISHSIGIGPAVRGAHYFGNRFFVEGGADIQAVYRTSHLDSTEWIWCNTCGTLPDQFEIDIEDEKSGLSWQAGISAGVGYQLGGGLSVKLGANLDIVERHTIDDRQDPNDGDTAIGETTGREGDIMFSIQKVFQ